jgi:hypothetical protein
MYKNTLRRRSWMKTHTYTEFWEVNHYTQFIFIKYFASEQMQLTFFSDFWISRIIPNVYSNNLHVHIHYV